MFNSVFFFQSSEESESESDSEMEAPQKVKRKPKQKAKVSKHETWKILQDDTKPFWNSSYPYSCGQLFDSLKTKFLFLNQIL